MASQHTDPSQVVKGEYKYSGKIRFEKAVKLPQPKVLDFSKLCKEDSVEIVIHNTHHKFATDAEPSGLEVKKQPIFGSKVLINGKLHSEQTFGLPFMRVSKGSKPKITYHNKTLFTFNIHYHGLDTVGSVDGVAMEVVFGHSTLLGPKATFQFPEVVNNQCLLWFHSHNMFISMELIYGGIVGLMQITDRQTRWMDKRFEYQNNQIFLAALDMDLTQTGTQTFENLIKGGNRSCFTVVNGVSAVNWYTPEKEAKASFSGTDKTAPFVNQLYHTTNRNLVKIDILNASLNWRVFHMGVCDSDSEIKSFYQVQTDSGLINPVKLKMVFVPVAGRVGIIVDLNKFKHKTAYLFFYNYDLTEVFASTPTFPDQPTNPTLTGIVPDLKKSRNPTPYPTPIPDPEKKNQQSDFTALDYPEVSLIPQTTQVLTAGSIPVPKRFSIKPFLKISLEGQVKELSLHRTLSRIQKTIFGSKFKKEKAVVRTPNFEYDPQFNYLSFLNQKYFYNLPKTVANPTRSLLIFFESNNNAIAGGNPNGTTEYVNGSPRLMADLWNSRELDLNFALQEYFKAPNVFKPSILPTSKFRIFKTNDKYSNTAAISNDTLTAQFFKDQVAYGDLEAVPLTEVKVVFPPTPECRLLNIQEWIDLANQIFSQTKVLIPGSPSITLDKLIECDWAFFPYTLNFEYQRTVIIKSAVIKTRNSSPFWIRFLARWPLLQFFGKPMTGNTLDSVDLVTKLMKKRKLGGGKRFAVPDVERKREGKERKEMVLKRGDKPPSLLPPKKNPSQWEPCEEFKIYGILDVEIQQIFPFYATGDGKVQLPIACMRRNGELIISPDSTYIGLYDGYFNDNLKSFSVKLKSSETWVYTNGDTIDAHSLHFHLGSSYVSPHSEFTSPGLVTRQRNYASQIYSRDVYQVGVQQVISFQLAWPYYSSYETTASPPFRCIGGMIHCHLLLHNDSNGMIISYFVEGEDKKSEKALAVGTITPPVSVLAPQAVTAVAPLSVSITSDPKSEVQECCLTPSGEKSKGNCCGE